MWSPGRGHLAGLIGSQSSAFRATTAQFDARRRCRRQLRTFACRVSLALAGVGPRSGRITPLRNRASATAVRPRWKPQTSYEGVSANRVSSTGKDFPLGRTTSMFPGSSPAARMESRLISPRTKYPFTQIPVPVQHQLRLNGMISRATVLGRWRGKDANTDSGCK